ALVSSETNFRVASTCAWIVAAPLRVIPGRRRDPLPTSGDGRAHSNTRAFAGDADSLDRRHLGEDPGDLEGAGHAANDTLVGGEAGDILAVEGDGARRRRETAADRGEKGGFC